MAGRSPRDRGRSQHKGLRAGMILLTGATGNVGRPLVGLLAEAGVSFKAFVRDPERARDLLGCDVELVGGDLAEPATLEAALEGVEDMFLLNGDPELEGHAIDVALRSGVPRVIKQSALADGLEPPSFHRRVEQRLERSGLGYTHLRPNAFMQTLGGLSSRPDRCRRHFSAPGGKIGRAH